MRHRAKESKALPRCLTCTNKVKKDVAHASRSSSCPRVSGRAPEVKGWEVKFLQVNLGVGGGRGSRPSDADGQEERRRRAAH